MIRNQILIYEPEISNRAETLRILSSTGSVCTAPETTEELEQAAIHSKKVYDIIILDLEGHQFLNKMKFNFGRTPTILVSGDPFGQLQSYLSGISTFTNFVAKSKDGRLMSRDLLATVGKILYGSIFGVKKYLNWGASNIILHVRDTVTRQEYVDAVLDYCTNMGVRKSLLKSVGIFSEELLMNALFDAPQDENGKARFAHQPRTQQVMLPPMEAARMEVASDGDRLAISVSDPFGAITRRVVLHYLSRCFEGTDRVSNILDPGGAGLGLYMCFNSVSSFIVNVSPGVRSEFIGIFDLNLSPKEHHSRHPSFHYFSTNNTATQFLLPFCDEAV